MPERAHTVRCPTCGTSVVWSAESRYRPFCSSRCRQIDLGAWASEEYRVPTSPPDANEDGGFLPPVPGRD